MVVGWMAGAASAAEGWQSPNTLVAVAVGTPTLLSIRGNAWFADNAEGELGIGIADTTDADLAFDWAIRWRPDFACVGCGTRTLVSFGVGGGGLALPPPGFDGPWSFAVGPDLAANFVWWFSPKAGLDVGGRVGVGPGWVGTAFDELEVRPWAFGSVGLAF